LNLEAHVEDVYFTLFLGDFMVDEIIKMKNSFVLKNWGGGKGGEVCGISFETLLV
jgi:hypothetical protein